MNRETRQWLYIIITVGALSCLFIDSGSASILIFVSLCIYKRNMERWRLSIGLVIFILAFNMLRFLKVFTHIGPISAKPWAVIQWIPVCLYIFTLIVLLLDRPSRWLVTSAADRD